MSVEQVLADALERAALLRSEGHPIQAATIERVVAEVKAALPEFSTWVSETDAMLFTGRKADYLRARFPFWEQRGLAAFHGRIRFFRRCVLEHRGNPEAVRGAGRRAIAGDAA